MEQTSDQFKQHISDLPIVLNSIQEANGCVVYGEALRSGRRYRRAEDGYEYKTKSGSSQRKDSSQGRPVHPDAQRGFNEILGNPAELSAVRTKLDTIEELSLDLLDLTDDIKVIKGEELLDLGNYSVNISDNDMEE